jgi:hypothetical protein
VSLTFAAIPRPDGISEIAFHGGGRPSVTTRVLTVGVVTTTHTRTGLKIVPVQEIGLEIKTLAGDTVDTRIPVVMARGLAQRIIEMCAAIESKMVVDREISVSREGVDG